MYFCRLHLVVNLLFVASQHVLSAGSIKRGLTASLGRDCVVILLCEVVVDMVTHSFALRFNNMKPEVYDSFTNDLWRRLLSDSGGSRACRLLGFVPLAPAVLLLRVFVDTFMNNFEDLTRDDVIRRSGVCVLCIIAGLIGKLLLGYGLQRSAHANNLRVMRKLKGK